MTFEELGAALRAERKKRNLSIEDIAERLKIGTSLLCALEEGDASSLPHKTYAKGFIRDYASFLGLDAGEVNDAMTFLDNENKAEAAHSVYAADFPQRDGVKWLLPLSAAVLLFAGGYMAQQHFMPDNTPKRLVDPAPPIAPSVAPPQHIPARSSADSADAPQNTSSVHSPVSSPPTQPPETEQERPHPTATAPQETALGATSDTRQTSPAAPHKIIITAIEECWIHSNADTTETRQFSLYKGETFALTFTTKLKLKLGNAGGVRVHYDGEDLPVIGQSGQVKTLTFPPAASQ
ncbi:MAG: conserved hypothetical protein [Candidatus Desulfovibrio kirbyi]|uniref:HTH cro/C1-type domain-containing protein n=1 Tax=Candidatus Desulfovibrio kirbyi TaxID=2696086 RepID=A0A6L2R6Z5_9BACT|nr:MAG: conserved hypothetical protein [Candidatus Desulfovibrio kirbyi]